MMLSMPDCYDSELKLVYVKLNWQTLKQTQAGHGYGRPVLSVKTIDLTELALKSITSIYIALFMKKTFSLELHLIKGPKGGTPTGLQYVTVH